MSEPMTTAEQKIRPSEEDALDRAIHSMDPNLRASLQREQKRRRQRTFLAGGILMAILATLLIGFFFYVGDPQDQKQEIQPEAAAQLSQEGWKLWGQQDYAKAEAEFATAVVADPKLDNAWNGLGWALLNQDKPKKAIEAFEKCVALTATHGGALNGLGQAYLRMGDYDTAEKYLLKAKTAPAAWYGLVRVYLLQGNFTEAKKWLKTMEGAGGFDESQIVQFRQAIEKEKLDDNFRRMFEPTPWSDGDSDANDDGKTAGQWSAEGWKFFNQGKAKQASDAFEKALKLDPENSAAMNGMAFSLLNQGQHEKAMPMFKKLLEKTPDAGGPMNGLARCLKASGKADEAIKIWKQMEEKSSGVTAATAGLAMTFMEQKNFAEAVPYLEQLAESSSSTRRWADLLKTAQRKLKQ